MAKSKPSLFQRGKDTVVNACQSVAGTVKRKWDEYHLTNYTVAITSATSTLKLSISTLPIILDVLTAIAAMQLFHFMIPEILFTPWIYIPVMIVVSGFAGYMKYHEQVERAKLDHQIIENKQKITQGQEINEKLGKTVTQLQKTLSETKQSLAALSKKCETKKVTPRHLVTSSNEERTLAPASPRRSERLRARI